MRRQKEHTVTRGQLTGRGINKTAAKTDLDHAIDWALESEKLHVEAVCKYVIVISRGLQGWSVVTVAPQDIATGGVKQCSQFIDATHTFDYVLQRARMNAAQSGWSRDEDEFAIADALKFRDELRREWLTWCTWQRCYQILKAAEVADNTAWRSAFDAQYYQPRIAAA